MRSLAISLFLVTAISAAAMSTGGADAQAPKDAAASACDASRARFAVGKHYGPAIGERIRKAARARTLRVLKLGDVYTMEFMFGRIDVEIDTRAKIKRVHCG